MALRPDAASHIVRTIRSLCHGTASGQETDRLIAIAAAIAKRRMHGRLYAAARVEGSSVDQTATSVIAGLFAPAGPGCMLAQSLAEHVDLPDDSLYVRFQAVVVGAASQELFHRWRENDPLSARLWRNLRRALRSSEDMVVFPAHRPRWVALAGEGPRDTHLPAPGPEELKPIVRLHSSGSYSIGDVVLRVLNDIQHLTHCAKILPLDVLFSLVREEAREFAAGEMNAAALPEYTDPNLRIAVGEARAAAEHEVKNRLEAYLNAGKLSPDRASHMERALVDLVADCCDAGPAQSYYEYVRAHAPELDLAEYRRDWRSRFEYLAELARERFFDGVRSRLGAGFPQGQAVAPTYPRKEGGSRL